MAEPDNSMTSLLSRFGVDYADAPAPTPATLAFMRGLGLSLDTMTAAKDKQVARIKDRTTSRMGDIDVANERTKTNMLGDLVRRGVLRSGESNTRYGQQAENVARQKSDALRAQAEGIDQAEFGFNTGADSLRTRALETVLGAETSQAQQAAALKAQEDSYKRQDEAAELSYQRSKEAEERALKAQEDFLKRGLGI